MSLDGFNLESTLFSPRPPESAGMADLVKTPFLANATALTLHDTAGRERARVPIDERFVTRAKDDGQNFWLLPRSIMSRSALDGAPFARKDPSLALIIDRISRRSVQVPGLLSSTASARISNVSRRMG